MRIPLSTELKSTGYSGNDGGSRQITTGMKCTLVLIVDMTTTFWVFLYFPNVGLTMTDSGGAFTDEVSTNYLHASNGFVVETGNNISPRTYYYWAIGES